jgi:hypothetical protein
MYGTEYNRIFTNMSNNKSIIAITWDGKSQPFQYIHFDNRFHIQTMFRYHEIL